MESICGALLTRDLTKADVAAFIAKSLAGKEVRKDEADVAKSEPKQFAETPDQTFHYFNSSQLESFIEKAVEKATADAFARDKSDSEVELELSGMSELADYVDEEVARIIDENPEHLLLRRSLYVGYVTMILRAVMSFGIVAMLATAAFAPSYLLFVVGCVVGLLPPWLFLERRP